MATARAFGSITIIDVTDIGQFSIYPMSNLPLSVIYSPDANTFSPNWSTNNLILTPKIYYAGQELSRSSNGLSITWQKMEGISTVNMNSSEVVGTIGNNTGILTVSANQFTSSSTLLTYIVNAAYVEPTSGTTLNAQGQITFSLVKMASEVRNVSINGDNIFKYNMNGIPDKQSTTLTAFATDTLTITDWEYSNDNGTNWTSLNNASSSLTIAQNSSIFSNNTVLIRVVAQDNRDSTSYYYDYITVLQLRDGTAAGNSLVLSNEDQMIPCDSNGNPTPDVNSAFSLAYTSVSIFESGTDITSQYTITAEPKGVLGAWTNSDSQMPTGTSTTTTKGSYTYYWVTNWDSTNNNDVAEVVFTATKGTETLIKKMSLVKIATGADGVSPTMYRLDVSSLTTNKSYTYVTPETDPPTIATTTFTPSSIIATAKQTVGTTTTPFAGYIKVYKDGGTTPIATGTATGGSYTLSGIGTTHVPSTKLTFELYAGSGASDALLDTQNVIVTSDGVKGQQGQQGDEGESAISINLTNPSDNISVGPDGKTTTQVVLTLPFAAYEGTSKIDCSITAANAKISINGTEYTPKITTATSSRDGSIVYTIPSGRQLLATGVKSANGSKTLTFTYTLASGQTGSITAVYSWAITASGTSGVNSKILQIATPQGYIFDNGAGSLQITAMLINGGDVQTENVTYQWYKFNPSSSVEDKYDALSNGQNTYSGVTTNTLTVWGTQVDSYASFKCVATYDNKPYKGYASLEDKTDPIQVAIISTVGTQIVNGNGVGCFYARVIKNDGQGTELDPLPDNVRFVTEKPSSLVNGAYYYFIDESTNSVTLKRATSTSQWSDASHTYEGTYNWTYRNYDNEVITTGTPATTGKIVYIDADLINKKLVIDVEVII